jgi:hypothetical protein
VLSVLGTIWAGAWLLVTAPATAPANLSALTAVAAVALLAALTGGAMRRALAAAAVAPSRVPDAALARAERRRDEMPRLCDPDAAGRPRPRAPSANPAA